jgi:hypothetical protein
MSVEKQITDLLEDLTYEAQMLYLCEKRLRDVKAEIVNLLAGKQKEKVKK